MYPSAAELVARYLRTSGYKEEASLDPDAGSRGGITIDQILQEKKTFDLSVQFEKLGTDDVQPGWRSPAPSFPVVLSDSPTRSNILSASVLDLLLPGTDQATRCIAATTADRRLNLFEARSSSPSLLKSITHFQDSPLLDLTALTNKLILASSMSGKLVLYNTYLDAVVDERRDHSKYIVKIATWTVGNATLVASAGWDSKVQLYKLTSTDSDRPKLGEPLATLSLSTLPETICFIPRPGRDTPVLLVTRRDSTYLYYYDVGASGSGTWDLTPLGKQNLAPHSNAWIVFSPSDVQLCPTDPSIVAVATSSTPHMKLLIVRLLVPPRNRTINHASSDSADPMQQSQNPHPPLTQAAQARAELQLQDREEAAIVISINTTAPQSAYSTPSLAWRPDGSGIYVTSDDGVVRGFESQTGKLISTLNGHDSGSKIRCLWAGFLEGVCTGDRTEWLLSGGFDQKLILWHSS
ncbi:hypothetical protein M011DRAFT_491378 [Sporormia fimetaria CBS 119925]|uniref:WD40 repeat-like protein n=1 Tax=Sporormia fimetaria CBS 119925 TaxID=1340428 RepID=A0A6A6VQ04_9PLEO|nr:hypothetical protein M011DRAFT_491378 [Sporormia fimetaria CBS 119925]